MSMLTRVAFSRVLSWENLPASAPKSKIASAWAKSTEFLIKSVSV